MSKLAIKADKRPKPTNKIVAIKLCHAFFDISLKVLLANRQPTDDPKINNEKSITLGDNL